MWPFTQKYRFALKTFNKVQSVQQPPLFLCLRSRSIFFYVLSAAYGQSVLVLMLVDS